MSLILVCSVQLMVITDRNFRHWIGTAWEDLSSILLSYDSYTSYKWLAFP